MIPQLEDLKKKLRPDSALALTLESSRVAVSFATPGGAAREIASLPYGADAVAANAEKIGKELLAALDAAGVRERRCVLCLPPEWAFTATADMPEITGEDLRGYLELRAEQEFPMSADEMRVAYLPYALPDGKKRVTIAAVPVKRMDGVDKMLAAAGCRAVSISLGIDGCFSEPKPALRFLANGTHTNVIVTAGGGVVAMRLLQSPGPTGENPFDPAAFYREVRITLGRLPEPLRQQVREAQFGGTPASARRLRDATSEQLLGLGIESTPAPAENADAPQAALQAAERYFAKQPVAFEFIVPEVNQWEVVVAKMELPKRKRAISIAAAIIAIPILTIFVRGRIEGYYTSRWDGMKTKYADLDTLNQKIMKFHPWFDPAPVTVQTIEGIAESFPEQGDVWAKTIHITDDGKVVVTGFFKNQQALEALIDKLRSRPGVNGLQIQQIRGEQFTFSYKTR